MNIIIDNGSNTLFFNVNEKVVVYKILKNYNLFKNSIIQYKDNIIYINTTENVFEIADIIENLFK